MHKESGDGMGAIHAILVPDHEYLLSGKKNDVTKWKQGKIHNICKDLLIVFWSLMRPTISMTTT